MGFLNLRFQYDSHAVHSVIGGAASLIGGAGTEEEEEEEEAGQHSAQVGMGEEREVRISFNFLMNQEKRHVINNALFGGKNLETNRLTYFYIQHLDIFIHTISCLHLVLLLVLTERNRHVFVRIFLKVYIMFSQFSHSWKANWIMMMRRRRKACCLW